MTHLHSPYQTPIFLLPTSTNKKKPPPHLAEGKALISRSALIERHSSDLGRKYGDNDKKEHKGYVHTS